MSFVMIATGGAQGGRVRTLSIRALWLGVIGCAAGLLLAGAGAGYWLARADAPEVAAVTAPASTERARAPLVPFALEHIGAISARLFRLESEAAQLSKRMGVAPPAAASAAAASASSGVGRTGGTGGTGGTGNAGAGPAGSGGPMLPPRADGEVPEDFAEWQARLQELEQRLAAVSDASAELALAQLRLPSRRPVHQGALVSVYGNRQDPFNQRRAFHAGLDFAAEAGSPIVAAGGGRVSFAGFRPDYGWTVEIDHGNGLVTRYAHASRLLVGARTIVAPGERIALVGSTGRSTGPHLHFEVLRHGETVDPRRYLHRH